MAFDEWETPPEIFDPLREEFDFDLDAAATGANHKVPRWLGPGGEFPDALAVPWARYGSRIWCNPPYSTKAGPVWAWVQWAKYAALDTEIMVMFLKADTSTRYFHDFIWDVGVHRPRDDAEVRFLEKRVSHTIKGKRVGSPTFGSMIVVLR